MDELAAALATVTGVRVHSHPPESITPPAGVVSYPAGIAFDQTYQRGMTKFNDLPVVLLAGKAVSRAARDTVTEWSADTGPRSIKRAIEARPYASCHVVTVTECSFDVVTIAGVDYLAATFMLDIVGSGN